MTAAGPSSRAVNKAASATLPTTDPNSAVAIRLIDVNDTVARRLVAAGQTPPFAQVLGEGLPVGAIVGRGDTLDIAIWEAPPAVLFGSVVSDPRLSSGITAARTTGLPEQMVSGDGRITVPFAGQVQAAGRTTQQIERDIVARLDGKAHQPQVVVRIVRNANANVTVVGDVNNSARLPLTVKGERLLEALAAAGGGRQPVGKMTVQVTRGDQVASMALADVIRDPRQNIRLQPDDVVTALFQPFSFTSLGATGRNEEINFEATGLTLAQALGRVGGLQDQRADVRGVFIFRLERPEALGLTPGPELRTTPDGKLPVIYRMNMKDPGTFFVAQGFPMRDKDVLYVSNAPLADVQKFVGLISNTIFPIATAITIIP
jgi:polysaccharide biosynthesis/export protein